MANSSRYARCSLDGAAPRKLMQHSDACIYSAPSRRITLRHSGQTATVGRFRSRDHWGAEGWVVVSTVPHVSTPSQLGRCCSKLGPRPSSGSPAGRMASRAGGRVPAARPPPAPGNVFSTVAGQLVSSSTARSGGAAPGLFRFFQGAARWRAAAEELRGRGSRFAH